MDFVIAQPAQAFVPVKGSKAAFPVHRIYCVGRNYAAHTVEMGGDPDRDPPFFFQKNPDNLVLDGAFPYPTASKDVHHEIEMIVALKSGGNDIPLEKALDCVYGYGVALDMTRRDLQGKAKDLGRPWEVGKAFEASAPCTALVPASEIGHPSKGAIWLDVNGGAQADRRSQPDDLESAGNDQLSLRPLHAEAGRSHSVGNAIRRGGGEPRRHAARAYRRHRRS